MRRWQLGVLLGLLVAGPVGAQRVQPSRLIPAVSWAADTVAKAGRQPLPAGFAATQTFVGLAGFSVGALAGGAIGAALAPESGGGFADLGAVLAGLAVGGALGSSVAVYRFSNAKGFRSSYAATLVGSVAGFFGGPLLWVTVPMGSTIGYNLARK